MVCTNIASARGSEINWIRRARDRPQPDRIPPHLHPTDSKMQVKYEKQAAEGETSKQQNSYDHPQFRYIQNHIEMFEGSRVKNIDTRKAPVKIPFAIHELEITFVAGSVT